MSLWQKIRSLVSSVSEVAKRKRAPRIHLLPMHNVSFRRRDRSGEKTVKVSNVSSSGIGFIRSSSSAWPAKGELIEGVLSIGGRDITIQARVMRVTPEVVGCSIDPSKYNLEGMIQTQFDRELSALSLQEATPLALRGAPEGKLRRLTGKNADLSFVVDSDTGKLLYFKLTFLGQDIEWGSKRGGNAVGPNLAQAATRFLENVEAIDLPTRKVMMAEVRKLSS